MKTLAFALLAAVLIASSILTPANAASTAAPALTSSCGDTYVVQPGNYLSQIARYCGVPLSTILAYNPQITNPSLIYAGQVIYLNYPNPNYGFPQTGCTYVVQPGDTLAIIAARYGTTVSAILAVNPQIYNPNILYAGQVINLPTGSNCSGTTPPPPNSTNAYATVSSTSVTPGSTVTVSAYNFPANAEVDYRLGRKGQEYSTVVDGKSNSSGYTSANLTIPTTAVYGEQWVVSVQTTSLPYNQSVTVYTPTIYINGPYYPPTTNAYVTISTNSVTPGSTVVVSGYNFPANAQVDYRVGKYGSSEYAAVVDGATNSGGYTSAYITIPSTAKANEQWVVVIQTTSLPYNQSVAVSSPIIYIK
jgi:LysM repeat protein